MQNISNPKFILFFFSDGQCDIHTNRDRLLPCRDHLIAKGGNCYTDESWVKYEIKVSETAVDQREALNLPNDFMNIQERLKYIRQIRLYCLLKLPLSSDDDQMKKVMYYYDLMVNFFVHVKQVVLLSNGDKEFSKFQPFDCTLLKSFGKIKNEIHVALCDNIDTQTAMNRVRELIESTTSYMKTSNDINRTLLKVISKYITHIINVFGLNPISSTDYIGFLDVERVV